MREYRRRIKCYGNNIGQPSLESGGCITSVGPDGAIYVCCCMLCLLLLLHPVIAGAAPLSLQDIISKKTETQATDRPATAITDESIEENKTTLEARLAELRLQLRPEAIATQYKTYRNAADAQELAEWERLMNRLAGILEDHVNSLLRLRSLRKANRDRAIEIKGWQGFTEKPPYPISLLDSLRDAIDAEKVTRESLEVMRSTVEGELEEFSSNLKESRKELRLAEETVERSSGKPNELRKNWLLSLVRLRDQVNQGGVLLSEVRQVSLRETLDSTQTEINFLEQKLAVAKGMYKFSGEELQQKNQAIDNRRQQLIRDLEQALHERDIARKDLEARESAMHSVNSDLTRQRAGKLPIGPVLNKYEALQILFDVADFRVQILKGMLQLLRNEKAIWNDRYVMSTNPERLDSRKFQKELEVIGPWKAYVASRASTLHVLIRSQQEKLDNASVVGFEREAARSIMTVYQNQEVLLRRCSDVIAEFEQLVLRRNEEAKSAAGRISLEGRSRAAFTSVSSLAMKIWNTELYVAEETIIAEGRTIVRPRSITVGKLLEALLILLSGAWVLRRLKRPIQWFAAKRLRLDENNALLYTKILTFLIFLVVFVGTLIFVNIPLAVFAFFGGALAIGVGFGGQNLINNFISGLILMFDHTIHIGDVVEMDGHRGRVTVIGMRNSRVKRFDGIEMLVPNNQFLQQNVINWTLSDKRVRYTVNVGVAHGTSTTATAQLILKAVEAQQDVLTDPPAYVTFDNFADSSLNFSAYFWLELDPSMNSLVICSDIRHRIGEMFADAGIEIPFPQLDLHLKNSPVESSKTGAAT